MSNTDLALLEVGNWLCYGEVRAETAQWLRNFLETVPTFCEGNGVVLMTPDNQGGAVLVRRTASGQAVVRVDENGWRFNLGQVQPSIEISSI